MAEVTVPRNITIHLGTPSSAAANITVPFTSYIKNVASSEIYPTWPDASLRANIYAITSFALNRIYTEYYRSSGYPFDITNSTAYDQAFIVGRDIFANIGEIVDDQFNSYLVRGAQVQPLFALYCSGTTVACNGLSQWGTVSLANQGYSPSAIVKHYYGDNVSIVENAPVGGNIESYPGRSLKLGSVGEEVRTIQRELNRIGQNYPAIPRVPVNIGIFDGATRAAVIAFQQIFGLTVDGIVGRATWYRLKFIYNSVKKLSEVYSEGLTISEVERIYSRALRRGDSGLPVQIIQYYLSFIGFFNENLDQVDVDGKFGPKTQAAVIEFQKEYGLTPDGIVGRATWNRMLDVYTGILNSLPEEYRSYSSLLYPGYFVTTGASGKVVEQVQTFLRTIARSDSRVPSVSVDGIYGPKTAAAVKAVQRISGLPETGEVGPLTWNAITNLYNEYR